MQNREGGGREGVGVEVRGWWGRGQEPGSCFTRGVGTEPALSRLLQNRRVTETMSFVTENIFTRWLWGWNVRMGGRVGSVPPQGQSLEVLVG